MKEIRILVPTTAEERRNHDVLHQFVNMDGDLTPEGEMLVHIAFGVLQKACYRNSVAHGWYDNNNGDRNFGEVCMLFTSEISEAFEEFRNGVEPTQIYYKAGDRKWEGPQELSDSETGETTLGKPEGIAAELADTFIRIFDTAENNRIPLAQALIEKHHYNFTRSYRHGGKKA